MKRLSVVPALIFAALSFQSIAADGTINFTGNIIDTACTLDTNSANQTVILGNVSSKAFNAAGSTAAPTKFNITLTTCPAAATSAKVTFDGTESSANPNILALNAGQTAGGVGVALYEQNGSTPVPLEAVSQSQPLVSTGPNTLTYVAKYMATAATVTAGTANATSTFTIIYN